MTWLRIFLFPFCLLYGLITWLRNKFFDWGLLPSKTFDIPVISVGNLSTGGTGKTPHAEFLIRMLQDEYTIALVSRGYKRKTRGLVVAGPDSTSRDIGDEPLQIYQKYPDTLVVVHEKRRQALEYLRHHHPAINLIIMDDGYQHRYVTPGLNLLLTEYYKPFFSNYLMPCGNLREFKSGAARAHALVITKTPKVFSPLDRRFFLRKLSPFRMGTTYFSFIRYGQWKPLDESTPQKGSTTFRDLFLFTGIANASALEEYLKKHSDELHVIKHSDHHQFRESDLRKLKQQFRDTFGSSKAVVVTEKDAMRLQDEKLRKIIRHLPVYYIPIEVDLHDEDKEPFLNMVREYLKSFAAK